MKTKRSEWATEEECWKAIAKIDKEIKKIRMRMMAVAL